MGGLGISHSSPILISTLEMQECVALCLFQWGKYPYLENEVGKALCVGGCVGGGSHTHGPFLNQGFLLMRQSKLQI